ncbi:MAG: aminotransferase [Flavobacteriales bacterium]|nr:MAG: aminotransferase [Flavobacteriales bacterium]
MGSRRNFFKNLGGTIGTLAVVNAAFAREAEKMLNRVENLHPLEVASDEDFWQWVKNAYTESPNIINLNNGGVSPQPKVVQEAFEMYNRLCNEAPSYYMWRILDKGRESLRQKLADLAGCSPEEIAINRNTTESLDTIIFGLNLNKGDEIVLSKYDYPNMMNAWKQRVKRDGIVLKFVDFALPEEDTAAIVKKYKALFTPKTKIVHITHIINWTGQILPSKEIAAEAHKQGIEVIVDGAHSFAHLHYNISDLGADYFGTSLHKWLCAPFGTGMLYVKKEKISNLWPTCPNDDPTSDDIRKFEHLGTRSFPTEQAIGHAINFHNLIGSKRKEERLRYLKDYWLDKVKDLPNVKVYTSQKPEFACALANIGIEGKVANEIERHLFNKHQIHTVSIKWEGVNGVRITPHVYTATSELDRLVRGLKELLS